MKKCPVCESKIIGREDKKFCSLKCKSAHQYQQRKKSEALFFKIDKQLKKNRNLLKKYNQTGFASIEISKFEQMGFNPNYFTHYWKNKKGEVYLFCYEYGFLKKKAKGKLRYVLIEWQDYMKGT